MPKNTRWTGASGSHSHWTDAPLGEAFEAEKERLAEGLRAAGRRPYVIGGERGRLVGAAAYALAGFAVGLTALVPAIAVGSFPAPIRFTGLSFSYNVAYAIAGGLTPVLLSLALPDDPAAPIHYIAAMAMLGAGLGLFVAWRQARVPAWAAE